MHVSACFKLACECCHAMTVVECVAVHRQDTRTLAAVWIIVESNVDNSQGMMLRDVLGEMVCSGSLYKQEDKEACCVMSM